MVYGQMQKPSLHRFGPGQGAADAKVVELRQQSLIFGALKVVFGLMTLHDRHLIRGHPPAQPVDVLGVVGDAGGYVADHEAFEVSLVAQRVLDAEHAVPGIAEQTELLQL
ncbi:hypothetical protein GCM10022631_00630 [Deinococcus rubellus]|uniref:hypothetical protein n=1 Tax=Deinococcus rubellus TaxID=1889240 RepID=UPI0031EC330F